MAEQHIPSPGGGGGGEVTVQPQIGDIVPITMKTDYNLPFDRQSNQTACGTTIQTQGGDKNWRVVIEGIITLPQLDELESMRGQDSVEVVTEEFGLINVVFDQLNVSRASDEERLDTGDYSGPLINFQLQSKEDTEESLFEDVGVGG